MVQIWITDIFCSPWSPNTILSSPFSNPFGIYSPLKAKDQVSHSHDTKGCPQCIV